MTIYIFGQFDWRAIGFGVALPDDFARFNKRRVFLLLWGGDAPSF
jgi:hypothetical protein